jgi:hypothetical protein
MTTLHLVLGGRAIQTQGQLVKKNSTQALHKLASPYRCFWYCFFDRVIYEECEVLNGPTVSALGVRSQNLSNVRKGQSSDGWPKFIISSSSVLRKAR